MCRLVLIDDNPEDRILILRELSREFPNLQAQEIIDTEGLNHLNQFMACLPSSNGGL